jgi:hypothetical protein
LVNVCAIEEPEPLDAPVKLAALVETVHAKVVPAILLVNAMDVAVFEQIVDEEGVAVATGTGVTVTVTLFEAVQPVAAIVSTTV